ncbi:F-box/kelch-repeat protein At3g06240-like [Camellia sinensis]|nr:F-box/kelch-repeat protein At3g06240-like [Camellia sinensis]XP_028083965.1 F-box/kelch-repeat protein At3g06240-like [Camellia sinensis]XP_028083966.1 F-box/kelch-repeat protein At3g06240-like [Camellia sinensis]
MALWNPILREFNRIHVLEPIFPPNFHAVTNVVGFGLDPLTRDYKIIGIRDYVETIGDETYDLYYPYHVAAIYTLGKDSGRHFDLVTIPKDRTVYNSLCATCINGAYYWLSGLDYSEYRILSFDMRLEEFRKIEGPDHPEPKWGFLSLHNDSMGLFLCQTGVILQSIIDIWVMEEEGCWTKLITTNPFLEVFLPRGFWKEELLFESQTNELVLYNHETHEMRNLEIYGCGSALGLWAICYKESLVSVFGQNDEDGRRRGYQFFDAVHDFFITSCCTSLGSRNPDPE